MRVAIRADASRRIGSGHVMRCAALAGFLRQGGAEVTFICREHDGHYCDWLEKQGYAVARLPAAAEGEAIDGRLAHDAWLSATQARDSEQTRAVLGSGWDWLIVDHYALDSEWEASMRPHAGRIMVIDDLADRDHDADLLLDQNLQARPDRYRGRLPVACMTLLGPAYALLRPEFARLRAEIEPRSGELKRVLVFTGGSDPHNLSGRALDAIQQAGLAVHIDVVIGGASGHLDAVRARCDAMQGCVLHVQTADMARLMASADLMIGAPGSTTWERCCLGLPSLLVSIADNQTELGTQISQRRAAIVLGRVEQVSAGSMAGTLKNLAQRPALLRAMSRRAARLVDGGGCSRVVAAMLGRFRITIVSDAESWINEYLSTLVDQWRSCGHDVRHIHRMDDIATSDLTFFLSCSQLAPLNILQRSVHNLVVHESELPLGRGWSPLTWQILEGKSTIPVTLFEATEGVDSGPVYLCRYMKFGGHELVDELRKAQAEVTIGLCRDFARDYPEIVAASKSQRGIASHYARRSPQDSRLDPAKSLAQQFDLLRVVDNVRYPAFFDYRGHRYRVAISMEDSTEDQHV